MYTTFAFLGNKKHVYVHLFHVTVHMFLFHCGYGYESTGAVLNTHTPKCTPWQRMITTLKKIIL